MEKKKVFRSRISILLMVFILAAFIPGLIPMFQRNSYIEVCGLGGILLFVILLFTGMRYIISGDELLIKIWFISCGSINIAEIISVERSYNPLSSPAASLKRLKIAFARGQYGLISPVREDKFIEELKAINPDIFVNVPEKKNIWRIQDWDI